MFVCKPHSTNLGTQDVQIGMINKFDYFKVFAGEATAMRDEVQMIVQALSSLPWLPPSSMS